MKGGKEKEKKNKKKEKRGKKEEKNTTLKLTTKASKRVSF